MKLLYLDLSMGAAGDMLAAALSGLLGDDEKLITELSGMNIPNVSFSFSPMMKCGIKCRHLSVVINGEEEGEHHHHGHCMRDIEEIVSNLNADEEIKRDIMNVYNIIAGAESRVHGKNVREIHFHEVGMMDAVADIAAVCLCMRKISPDKVVASPVHVGSGQVRCAHGLLPVPAPATAEILSGIPIYGGEIRGELCTPTGAALIKYFVSEFGKLPQMVCDKISYGAGKKDFDAPNCIRAMLGNAEADSEACLLCANIDDMTGEEIAYAAETILSSGALDVWTENIGMKKGRPGIKFCVLCKNVCAESFAELIFRHTATIGIRKQLCERYVLSRREETATTELGTFRRKISEGYGAVREKLEFEDLKSAAEKNGMSIFEIRENVLRGED